jgi:hypothetical protein
MASESTEKEASRYELYRATQKHCDEVPSMQLKEG